MSKEKVKVIRRPFAGYERSHDVAEDAELTHVGPGTPCGEFMRRIWQPVALSSELNGLPLAIRMLGEDLVLFRTRKVKPDCSRAIAVTGAPRSSTVCPPMRAYNAAITAGTMPWTVRS